jgi:hypothetical protein
MRKELARFELILLSLYEFEVNTIEIKSYKILR